MDEVLACPPVAPTEFLLGCERDLLPWTRTRIRFGLGSGAPAAGKIGGRRIDEGRKDTWRRRAAAILNLDGFVHGRSGFVIWEELQVG
ncbi:hypothetical protein ACLOJK_018951 [Asimina triloba]